MSVPIRKRRQVTEDADQHLSTWWVRMVRINAISHKVAYISFLGKVLKIGLHPHHPHPLQYASCIQPFKKKHWTGLHMVRTRYAHARKKKTVPSSRVLGQTH
jgi:hypothetical protein